MNSLKPRPLQAVLWWVPAIIWAGVIYYMSTKTFSTSFTTWLLTNIITFLHVRVSPDTFEMLEFGMRKLAHMSEYAIFALFLYHAISSDHNSVWRSRKALLCIVIAGLYSLSDEFHQMFVPGRGPSIVDCGIDTAGATIGMIILYFAGGRLPESQDQSGVASAPGGNP